MVLGDQKGRGVPPHNKCEHTPFSLCTGIHLGKMCTHVGRDLDRPGMPKKWDNWSEENKDPEEVPCVSDLNHLYGILLLIRADAHTLSLQVYTSALLLSQINKLLLCVLFHMLCCANNNKLFFFFLVFASLRHSCFQTGTRGRTTSSL